VKAAAQLPQGLMRLTYQNRMQQEEKDTKNGKEKLTKNLPEL